MLQYHIRNSQFAIRNLLKFKKAQMYTLMLCAAMFGNGDSQQVNAQVFRPSTTADYQYPTALMSPSTYYLDASSTNQLSNFAMQSSRVGSGHEIAASGWSDGSNGGFCVLSYGGTTPPLFAGRNTIALPDVRDVQVAFLENDASTYVVVAYYNNATSNYGYKFYEWFPGAPTLLYTYSFVDPHYPNLPSSINSTMGYNRIAIDVSKDKQKIAFVLTDGNNSNMYTAVGQLMPKAGGGDSIFFSPNLPHPVVSAVPGGGSSPFPSWYDPAAISYDPVSGIWSYGPPYNPLMRIRAQSSLVTSPAYRPEYKQLWPDVAFNENNITYSFYCPETMGGISTGLKTVLVFQNLQFTDLFNYTGSTAFNHYCEYFEMANNTDLAGGYIYDPGTVPPTGIYAITSLTLTSGQELRANVDAPDMISSTWALAFAYGNEVYARYYDLIANREVKVNNSSMGNFNIAAYNNIDADIAYNPAGNRLHLAWVSEGFPSFPMITTVNDKSIIGLEINPNVPYSSPTVMASLVSLSDYLIVPFRPHPSFGDRALVALSKHAYDLDGLYTSFCQEDETNVYSVMHKYHLWNPSSSPSTWRTTDPSAPKEDALTVQNQQLSIAPNPFSEVLTLSSSNPKAVYSIRISDMLGKQYYKGTGTAAILNADLSLSHWAAGTYLLHSTDAQGNSKSIKLIKK